MSNATSPCLAPGTGARRTRRCHTAVMARFAYAPEIVERFPSIVGGVIHADGVTNPPAPAELTSVFRDEQQSVRARIGETPLSELPTLAAWRGVFRRFGVDPTKYRSAAEALLRRLTKQGDVPSISTLVDLANLVSIRYALPIAVFDQRAVVGGTTVRLADGHEAWADLGASETDHPEPGEVIFADDDGTVSARRWCWRQSRVSAAQQDTTEILITVEGHHERAADDIDRALRDLQALLGSYAAPATVRSTQLSVADRVFD
jgi:DNA/RNA-binding domain of Phe-tRNA-synthetase-like protein